MKYRILIGALVNVGVFVAIVLWNNAKTPALGAGITANPVTPRSTWVSLSSPTSILTPEPASTSLPLLSPTFTPPAVPSPTITPTPFFEPAGCRLPLDDYEHSFVNGWQLNQRTYTMLQYAAELYDGPLDIADAAITQGSYSDNGPASFGTHLGGGAVDLSVIPSHQIRPLYTEIEALIKALRVAGFAAWFRDVGDLYDGSPVHIHAIAIGDQELSPQAVEQLTGPFGYFRGYTGIPTADGVPLPDEHGGPLVCQWMRNAGYGDLRPAEDQLLGPTNWQEKLKQVAQTYVAADEAETYLVAYRLDFRPLNYEDPSLMCGPLAAAILRDAGLLPTLGPGRDPKNYWLADPQGSGLPWTFFSSRDYDVYQFSTAVNQFDFGAWPLAPADFLYTYQFKDGYEHMFVVTEVDALGRAYTVTNNRQANGNFIVQRLLLYDPQDPTAGVFHNDWVNSRHIGRTGLNGFDVLRRQGAPLPSGTEFAYSVEPGDTLPTLIARFNSAFDTIVTQNDLTNPYALSVGQKLIVKVNIAFEVSAPIANDPDIVASNP